MRDFIQKYLPHTVFTGLLIAVASLFYKSAWLSIGSILVCLPIIFTSLSKSRVKLWKNTSITGISVIFLMTVLSRLYIEDVGLYIKELQLKLPFLFVAWGIVLVANDEFIAKLKYVYYVFIATITLVSILTLANYYFNYITINQTLGYSGAVPVFTGKSHIYFGMSVAFAIFLSIYVAFKYHSENIKNILILLLASISNLLLILLTANRTGMLCIIAVFAFLLIYFLIKFPKKGFYTLSGLVIVVIITFLSVKYIPAIKIKYGMTRYDLEQLKENNPDNYSISMRIETLKIGWEVFSENLLIGVGPSEVGNKMKEMYVKTNSKLSIENRWNPHNQFFYTFVSFGLIGGSLFLIAFILPFFNGQLSNIIFMIFWVTIFATMQVEAIFERQIGIAFFVIFWTILQLEIRNVKQK